MVRESRWKLLNLVLMIYLIYSIARLVIYNAGSMQGIAFDVLRIGLIAGLLVWLNWKSDYAEERKRKKEEKSMMDE